MFSEFNAQGRLKNFSPSPLVLFSGQLAKELKQQDCLQYAAFCNLAMAR